MNKLTIALCVASISALTACGGSKTSTANIADYQSQLASLQTMDSTLITPEADLPTSSATYTGVANMTLSTSQNDLTFYLGELELNVDFANDSVDGSVENLARVDATGGSNVGITGVSGSVDITNGSLTGNNTGIGNGLTASATGTVDGHDVDMDVTGHFFGGDGGGVALYFDDADQSTVGGIGLATR